MMRRVGVSFNCGLGGDGGEVGGRRVNKGSGVGMRAVR